MPAAVLSSRHEVTVEDVKGALARPGIKESEIQPGDAILFSYGWALNRDNPAKYNNADYDHPENKGSPGIVIPVARWLAEKTVSLVHAASCCVEVIPNPDASLKHPVHQELITLHGIYLLENPDHLAQPIRPHIDHPAPPVDSGRGGKLPESH